MFSSYRLIYMADERELSLKLDQSILLGLFLIFLRSYLEFFKIFLFSSGIIIVLTPPLCAARSFSFNPPIWSTSPLSVISPVIATSFLTGICVNDDIIAVHIPTPALGPSLGVAPSGTCTCISFPYGSPHPISAG